ncbi:MAG: hypothetical protein IJ026_00585 [Candidatus Methanomethylophilaceae archaeon]|nr:hypothetical protein [Candidatus Methanomethylophilaceae archaeon]
MGDTVWTVQWDCPRNRAVLLAVCVSSVVLTFACVAGLAMGSTLLMLASGAAIGILLTATALQSRFRVSGHGPTEGCGTARFRCVPADGYGNMYVEAGSDRGTVRGSAVFWSDTYRGQCDSMVVLGVATVLFAPLVLWDPVSDAVPVAVSVVSGVLVIGMSVNTLRILGRVPDMSDADPVDVVYLDRGHYARFVWDDVPAEGIDGVWLVDGRSRREALVMVVAVTLLTVSALLQHTMGDHVAASLTVSSTGVLSVLWMLSMSLRLHGTGDGSRGRVRTVRMRSHGMWTSITAVDGADQLSVTACGGTAFIRWRLVYLVMGAMILSNVFISLVGESPGMSTGMALVFLPVFLYTVVSYRTGGPSDADGDTVDVCVTDQGNGRLRMVRVR